jgi:hypothetical protein
MKTRAELLAEYDRLLVTAAFNDFEKAAVINTLQWVLWGNGTPPSEWLVAR